MAKHVIMRKRNKRDDNQTLMHKRSRKLGQELKNTIYTTRIIHKINISSREHYKRLMKIGFAAKAFS